MRILQLPKCSKCPRNPLVVADGFGLVRPLLVVMFLSVDCFVVVPGECSVVGL